MSFAALYGGNCAGCHGADGRLGASRPLNDPVYLALVPRERLREVIARGVPGTSQPAFAPGSGGTLTDAQIDALVRGLAETWGRPDAVKGLELPPYAAQSAGDPERGKAVYAAACASCHGPDGKGGPKGGAVADPSYLALVSDQYLRTTVIAGRADLGHARLARLCPGTAADGAADLGRRGVARLRATAGAGTAGLRGAAVTKTLAALSNRILKNPQAAQKGPAARRRPKAAREAYSLYVERAAEGANEADGPFQQPDED